MVKKTARKGNQVVRTSKAAQKKDATATPPAAAPTAQISCRVWRAWKGDFFAPRDDGTTREKRMHGLLITEPNNLDAPIAYLVIGEPGMETEAAALNRAALILGNPAHIDKDDLPMDLRDRCRWWSTQPTPEWLYDLAVVPAEGVMGEAATQWVCPIDYQPLCAVTMARMVDQFLRQRFDEDREKYPFTALAMFEMRDADTGQGMEGSVETIIWRGDDPHEISEKCRNDLKDAKQASTPAPIQLSPIY